MYGMDTPESRTRDKEEKYRGILSKEYLKEALKGSKEVILKTKKGEETGKFGRILAEVWVDGVNINKKMISEGYAVAYHGQSKASIEKKHESNKQKLIEAGVYKYKG